MTQMMPINEDDPFLPETVLPDSSWMIRLYRVQPCVYILKFDRPIGGTRKHAQHYCGFCNDERMVHRRIAEHRGGGTRASAICRAFHAAGIGFTVVAVLRGGRALERSIKRNGIERWLVREQRRKEKREAQRMQMSFDEIGWDAGVIPF